jgi:hypothetical protein
MFVKNELRLQFVLLSRYILVLQCTERNEKPLLEFLDGHLSLHTNSSQSLKAH